jgi:hypothetical protein
MTATSVPSVLRKLEAIPSWAGPTNSRISDGRISAVRLLVQ